MSLEIMNSSDLICQKYVFPLAIMKNSNKINRFHQLGFTVDVRFHFAALIVLLLLQSVLSLCAVYLFISPL